MSTYHRNEVGENEDSYGDDEDDDDDDDDEDYVAYKPVLGRTRRKIAHCLQMTYHIVCVFAVIYGVYHHMRGTYFPPSSSTASLTSNDDDGFTVLETIEDLAEDMIPAPIPTLTTTTLVTTTVTTTTTMTTETRNGAHGTTNFGFKQFKKFARIN